MLRLTILFYSILLSCFTNGQNYAYQHFSVEDGLPSSEVYDVLQDDDGFMWFATDRGIARYDGYEFDVFTTENGLLNNVVFHLSEGKDGRIWFDSSTGDVCYYQDGEIFEYKYNKKIHECIKKPLIGFFYVDKNENIHIGTYFNGYLRINQNGKYEHKVSDELRYNFEIIDKYATYYRNNRPTTRAHFVGLQYPNIDLITLSNINIKNERVQGATKIAADSSFYASFNHKLFKISPKEIRFIKNFSTPINCLTIHEEKLYCGLANNGCVILNINNDFKQISTELEQYSISDIQYNENTNLLWLTTLENGVFLRQLKSNYIINEYNGLSSSYIKKLYVEEDKLIAFSQKKESHFIDISSKQVTKTIQNDPIQPFPQFIFNPFTNKTHLFFHSMKSNHFKDEKSNTYYSVNTTLAVGFLDSNRLIAVKRNKENNLLGEIKDTSFYVFPIKQPIKHNDLFEHSVTTKSGKMFIICQNNLFEIIFDNRSIVPTQIISLSDKHPLLKSKITVIVDYNDQTTLFGTKDNGLVILKDGKTFSLNKQFGILSNHIKSICVDSSKTIWIGNSKGLSIIEKNKSLINISQQGGFLPNEITDIIIEGNEAFIATKNGISVFPKSELTKPTLKTPVFIKEIRLTNNKSLPVTDSIHLKHNQPIIDIKFVGINYKKNRSIQYKYRLNENEVWNYTDNNRIVLSNQPPGQYKLEIYASTQGVDWSIKPAVLFIDIAYPFWRTNWFYSLLTITLFSIFLLLNKISNRNIRNKERNKRQIQQLRFQALNAQMNPHFMFNSLNSIQNFIISGNKKDSVRYLAKFAKLMREILNHSQQHQITLEQEIKALKTYIDLEVFRFDNSFSCFFHIDKEINLAETAFPPLLLQPIVENAIIHGIRPMKDGGEINIHISQIQDFLKIDITDNGVGRKKQKIRKEHVSKGQNLTIDRLALFAKRNNSKHEYKITDLGQTKTGTKISIQIPLVRI